MSSNSMGSTGASSVSETKDLILRAMLCILMSCENVVWLEYLAQIICEVSVRLCPRMVNKLCIYYSTMRIKAQCLCAFRCDNVWTCSLVMHKGNTVVRADNNYQTTGVSCETIVDRI